MFTNWNQFITWEKSTNDTIDVKTTYIDISEDFMAGVLLSQIVYWYLPNKQGKSKLRVKKDGHYWIAKKREEWYEEIRFTEANYKTAIKKLEKMNLVVKERFKFNGSPTTHIRLNIKEFLIRLNEHMKNAQGNLDSELQDFNHYLEQEMNIEPLNHMDSVDSTEWNRLNQPNENGRINRMKTVESTESLTESTTESTTKITLNSMCSEETEILSLLKSRSDINKHIHKQLIDLLNAVKKKDTFQYSIFVDTLDLIDFDIQDLNYFKRALTNNFKKGYVRTATDKAPTGSIRKEVLPDWFDEDEYKTVKPAAQQNEVDPGQKKQELEDMLKRLRV
jgi:hypothetical protein